MCKLEHRLSFFRSFCAPWALRLGNHMDCMFYTSEQSKANPYPTAYAYWFGFAVWCKFISESESSIMTFFMLNSSWWHFLVWILFSYYSSAIQSSLSVSSPICLCVVWLKCWSLVTCSNYKEQAFIHTVQRGKMHLVISVQFLVVSPCRGISELFSFNY